MASALPTGGDSDRMLEVETRLRTEINDIGGLLTTHITTANALAPDAVAPLGRAVSLATTFCQETGIVADVIRGARQGLGFADGTPVDMRGLLTRLGLSLTDSDGAIGAPESFVEDLARRTFGDVERPSGNDYVEQLLDHVSTDGERQAIWASLSDEDRMTVLDDRPDLGVVFLDAGTLDAFELRHLRHSIAYRIASTNLELSLGVEVKARVFTIAMEGGVSVTIERLSNGTFKMLVGANAAAGISRDLDTNGVEVSAGLRAMIESGQVMQFDNEHELIEAVTTLENAIADDASDWGGTGRYVGGILLDANPVSATSRFFGGWSPGQWLDGDQRPESIKALERIMETHGTSTRFAAGVEGSADLDLDAIGLAGLEATGKVSVVAYHVDGLNGARDSDGIVLAGSLEGTFSQDSPPLVPGTSNADITGGGTIGFSSDTSIDELGDVVNVTTFYLETSIGTVESVGLGDTTFSGAYSPDGSPIELSRTTDVTQRHTVTFTTPVTEENAELVVHAATGLAGGDIDGVLALYDAADVTVTSEGGVRAGGSVKVDLSAAGVEVEASVTEKITTGSTHKPPGGEPYNQIEVAERIDAADERMWPGSFCTLADA